MRSHRQPRDIKGLALVFGAKPMNRQGEIAPIGHDLPLIFAAIGAHWVAYVGPDEWRK